MFQNIISSKGNWKFQLLKYVVENKSIFLQPAKILFVKKCIMRTMISIENKQTDLKSILVELVYVFGVLT